MSEREGRTGSGITMNGKGRRDEMNVSLEKMRLLWGRVSQDGQNEDAQINLNSFLSPIKLRPDIIEYAQRLYNSLEKIWEYDLPKQLRDSQKTALDDDCPTNSSDEVYNRLLENSQELGLDEDREKCRELVWGKLSAIKGNREPRFRVSSNAGGFSPFETFNTTCVQMNPDSWVYSYNYPWHVIAWLKDVREGITPKGLSYGGKPNDAEGTALEYRFVYKYLWMLACEDVIPILSLRSFINLLPFFREVWPNVTGQSKQDFDRAFGIDASGRGLWKMTKKVFEQEWRKLSKGIVEAMGITNADFKRLRLKLAAFLFAVSLTESSQQDLETLLENGNKAVVLYGPPGTGKTRAAKAYAFSALGIDLEKSEFAKIEANDRVCYKSEKGEMTLVQFHPNYSYQDFVGGIFPGVDKNTKQVFYEIKEGVFKKICDEAAKEKNNNKKFYLIIDEINRADLSSVFGELMYGLEYRDSTMNIPTFGAFKIPKNVYLIGTMNNTDKSLVGFDLALRRRFAFLKIPPNMIVLEQQNFLSPRQIEELRTGQAQETDQEEFDVAQVFAERAIKLNKQLREVLHLPIEKQIGHAYFLRVKDFCGEPIVVEGDKKFYQLKPFALEQLWTYHILPLLEEYLGLEFEDRIDEIDDLKENFCKEF